MDYIIAPLRAKKYIQTIEALCVKGPCGTKSFCCLGVGAIEARDAGVPIQFKMGSPRGSFNGEEYLWSEKLRDLHSFFGADNEEGWFLTFNGEEASLATWNDRGLTFELIAQGLEDQVVNGLDNTSIPEEVYLALKE